MLYGSDHDVLLLSYNQRGRKHDHDRVGRKERQTLDSSSFLVSPQVLTRRRRGGCLRSWTRRRNPVEGADGDGGEQGCRRVRKEAYNVEVARHAAFSGLRRHGWWMLFVKQGEVEDGY